MDGRFLGTGAVLGFLGVGAGALGAHALREKLSPEMLAIYETAVRYQLVHALALLCVGLWAGRQPRRPLAAAGWLLAAGTVVFSGSLFVLSLSGLRWPGAVTPVGGVALLAGWLLLAWSAFTRPRGGGEPC